jgi:hypothetical protein
LAHRYLPVGNRWISIASVVADRFFVVAFSSIANEKPYLHRAWLRCERAAICYCREIAESTGGKYSPLSRLSPEALYRIVDREQQLLFEKNT